MIHVLPVELSRKKIAEIREKIERKNSVFAEKRYLDSMYLPSKIIGRQIESEQLLSSIMSLKDGFIVPFILVYGRSGSGKSTVVKFVCENLLDLISFRFVNLQKARTVFGCANMILGNLEGESLSSAQVLNKAVDCMQYQIEAILKQEEKKYFVLVLDEYDVIFSDTRSNPSDFVYKLLQMEENLREKGIGCVSLQFQTMHCKSMILMTGSSQEWEVLMCLFLHTRSLMSLEYCLIVAKRHSRLKSQKMFWSTALLLVHQTMVMQDVHWICLEQLVRSVMVMQLK